MLAMPEFLHVLSEMVSQPWVLPNCTVFSSWCMFMIVCTTHQTPSQLDQDMTVKIADFGWAAKAAGARVVSRYSRVLLPGASLLRRRGTTRARRFAARSACLRRLLNPELCAQAPFCSLFLRVPCGVPEARNDCWQRIRCQSGCFILGW